MKSVRVLVTDLDDTLLSPESDAFQLPEGFGNRLRRWRDRGGTWVVATGRPEEQLRECLERFDARPRFFVARERYLFETAVDSVNTFAAWNRRMRRISRETRRQRERWAPHLEAWSRRENRPHYRDGDGIWFESGSDAVSAQNHLSTRLPEGWRTIRYDRALAVVPEEIGKGSSLLRLAQHLGLRPGEFLCVGDGDNDRDMLDGRHGFAAAAVQNADPSIRSAVRAAGGRILEEPGGRGVVLLMDRLLNRKEGRAHRE